MHACIHSECLGHPPTPNTTLSTVSSRRGPTPCMVGVTSTRNTGQKRASCRSTASCQRPYSARVRHPHLQSYNGAQLRKLEVWAGVFCIGRSLDDHPRLLQRASTANRSVLGVVVGCAGHCQSRPLSRAGHLQQELKPVVSNIEIGVGACMDYNSLLGATHRS